jgi:hypothetical protein
MLRRVLLSVLAVVLVGCGGDGGNGQTFKSLSGELTDGDVIVMDDHRADPYDFLAVRSGMTTVRLHTEGFRAVLNVYDTEGNLLAQSTETGANDARVEFNALVTTLYKVMVTSTTPEDRGTYTIEYGPELEYQSQIR